MKFKHATLAVTLALVAGAAFAQTTPTVPTAPVKGQNKASKLPPELQPVVKELRQSYALMEKALPIYDGHRLLALALEKQAFKELQKDAKGKAKGGIDPDPSAGDEGHDKTKYTPQQFAESQKRMADSDQKLDAAIAALQADTSANFANAIAKLQHADRELKLAAQVYSGNGN